VKQWPIWSLSRRLVLSVLIVELTALVLVLAHVSSTQLDQRTLLMALGLSGLGVVHDEIAIRVERIRRRITETPHVDFSSVWTFAGAIVLPPALAAAVAVVIFTHLWWCSWRPRVQVYRHVFSASTVVLACLAASAVFRFVSGNDGAIVGTATELPALLIALLVYTTVNSCLVAGAIAVSTSKPDLVGVFGDWQSNLLEIATLSLGALTAVALTINPLLLIFVPPPVLVLHRSVLVHQLIEAARTDLKTGLLNAAAWHNQAERALTRGKQGDGPRGVLVLDLDHFKRVNDTYGHLAGDEVLVAVANALRGEVRDQDLVGRFGGEEFVVLLGGLSGGASAELNAVAERMRRRVADLRVEIPTPDGPMTVSGLTVSVGGAVHSRSGEDLRTLLYIADTALYSAKRGGRNQVRIGRSLSTKPAPTPYAVGERSAGEG
jgi:diguanylate cyclase (GGDEF)-like protein